MGEITPTPEWVAWVNTIQTIVMGAAALFIGVLWRSFSVGKWAQSIDHGPEIRQLREDIKQVREENAERIRAAGQRMSDLADLFQVREDRLMDKLATRDAMEILIQEGRADRVRLHAEIDRVDRTGREDKEALQLLLNAMREALDRRKN